MTHNVFVMQDKKIILPITPDEAYERKIESIDPEMIQAVNELIIANMDSYKTATIKQGELVEKYFSLKNIDSENKESEEALLYKRHQLDFEDIYKKSGWDVTYTKSDYTENWFEPYFKFKKRKKDSQ